MKYENPRFKDIFLICSREGQLIEECPRVEKILCTTVKYCVTYSTASNALPGSSEFIGQFLALIIAQVILWRWEEILIKKIEGESWIK